MKEIVALFLAILMLMLLLAGCKKDEAKVVGETSHGTPIVELEKPEIPWETTKDSDCFNAIAYDADNQILYVSFARNDAKYRYLDFPANEWRWFKKADSLGSYYNKNIKGKYTCQKITGEE